ncbi:MAG: hypothetical protein AAF636_11455 [Pseudomonadota bacterium]
MAESGDDFSLDFGDSETPMKPKDQERSERVRQLVERKDLLAKMNAWDQKFLQDLDRRKPRKYSRAQRKEIDRIWKAEEGAL